MGGGNEGHYLDLLWHQGPRRAGCNESPRVPTDAATSHRRSGQSERRGGSSGGGLGKSRSGNPPAHARTWTRNTMPTPSKFSTVITSHRQRSTGRAVAKADTRPLGRARLQPPGPATERRATRASGSDRGSTSAPPPTRTPTRTPTRPASRGSATYRPRGGPSHNEPALLKITKFFKNEDWETAPECGQVNKHKHQVQPAFPGLNLQPETFFHLLYKSVIETVSEILVMSLDSLLKLY